MPVLLQAEGGRLEQLPPEGEGGTKFECAILSSNSDCCSGSTVHYMADEVTATGNPITDSKVLVGVPRRKNTTGHPDASNLPPLTPGGHHGNPGGTPNGAAPGEGVTTTVTTSQQDESGASSPSEEESSEGSEGSSSEQEEQEEELTDDKILKDAGVDLDIMAALAAHPPSGGVAPLSLLSEVSPHYCHTVTTLGCFLACHAVVCVVLCERRVQGCSDTLQKGAGI